MAGLDASVLTLILNPDAKSPPDPTTEKPISKAKERVDYLLATLQQTNKRIVIPTPVLSEVLVRAGKEGLKYIETIRKSEHFAVKPFDEISAIELAEMNRRAIADGNKTAKTEAPYQKIKVDRQIVAICKIAGVQTLYACDKPLTNYARLAGLNVIGLHELPLPPSPPKSPQIDLFDTREGETEEVDTILDLDDADEE
jgi:predicted nucleic acid-binding protein